MVSSKLWVFSSSFMLLLLMMATAEANSNTPTRDRTPHTKSFNHPKGEGSAPPQNPRGVIRCNQNPRICLAKGSLGPNCCKNQCVDVWTDIHNCGRCGKKCGYFEKCCEGRCVKVYVDRNNCGRCNNRCMDGRSCVYGMCSYA